MGRSTGRGLESRGVLLCAWAAALQRRRTADELCVPYGMRIRQTYKAYLYAYIQGTHLRHVYTRHVPCIYKARIFAHSSAGAQQTELCVSPSQSFVCVDGLYCECCVRVPRNGLLVCAPDPKACPKPSCLVPFLFHTRIHGWSCVRVYVRVCRIVLCVHGAVCAAGSRHACEKKIGGGSRRTRHHMSGRSCYVQGVSTQAR